MAKEPLYPHVPKQRASLGPQTGSTPARLWGVINKFDQKYKTLEEAEEAARNLGLTPSGTKREIVIDIVIELLSRALEKKG